MQAIPIHQAKANLSKYIQQAKAGKPVYIGSYGKAEVQLTVIPRATKPNLIGALKDKLPVITDEEWETSDKAMMALFEESANRDL